MAAEKTFENKVKKYIEDQGGWQVKFFANRMTKSGVPDILACINGYFLAIEVKAQNGKPSELQKYNVRKINDADGYAVILYPQDYIFFQDLVNSLKKRSVRSAKMLVYQINERSLQK